MSLQPPVIHRLYQTSADKRFRLISAPPPLCYPPAPTIDCATHLGPARVEYRVYFNREPGLPSGDAPGAAVITIAALDAPGAHTTDAAEAERWSAEFHVPQLECAVYFVCVRVRNPFTLEESDNTDQRIVPVCEATQAPGRYVVYGPNGSIYTRDPETIFTNGRPARLLRSFDHGDTWETLCLMPGDSGDVPGFAVDSKGYIYAASSPTPCVSRDDGRTFEPMCDARGETVNLTHATQFWRPGWNVTELEPGAHPEFPHGGIFLSTYALGAFRGPCDPRWMQPDPANPGRVQVWYDGSGALETDRIGRGYRILYARDPERRVWEYVDVTDEDSPNDINSAGDTPLADRHIHGFKINPYAPMDWYLSTGDGLWIAETEANFERRGRDVPENWEWEGGFTKRRGLYRIDSSFHAVQLRGPYYLNGPTGLSFFPDGTTLVGDDTRAGSVQGYDYNAARAEVVEVRAGIHRYDRDGRELDYFDPSRLDARLTGVMYDAVTLEGSEIAFVSLDDDAGLGRSDTALLTNLNGAWETLIQLPADCHIQFLSADSRKLIPRDAAYLHVDAHGVGNIRVPLKGLLSRTGDSEEEALHAVARRVIG